MPPSQSLLNLRVKQVSLADHTIRLNAGETKSGEGRVVKLTQDVYVLLSACVYGKRPEEYVFTRKNGQPVRDFRGTWHALCVQAGLGKFHCADCANEVDTEGKCPNCGKERKRDELRYVGLLFHDLRRSAVRNMIRRGVPQVTAMKISGHKTREIFDRYNIVDESDLADAARRIEESRASDFCQVIDRVGPKATKTQSVPTGSSRAN